MKKILLTGASGFIGKNFIKLLPENCEVYAIYNSNPYFLDFIESMSDKKVHAYKLDLVDLEQMRTSELSKVQFDVCLFLSANGDPAYSVDYAIDDLQKNTMAVMNTIECFNIKSFIYFSSGAVYDHLSGAVNPSMQIEPTLPYAISKYAAERYIEFYINKGVLDNGFSVRFFGAYGEYEPPRKIYSKLVQRFSIEKGDSFDIKGDGKNYINAMYVDDTIDAIMRTINYLEKPDKKYTVADLYAVDKLTLKGLVEEVADCFDIKPTINFFGEVPEYIAFYSNDDFYKKVLKFESTTPLKDGLNNLNTYLKKENRQ